MYCTAQLFVDAMATRRHIRREYGTEPVTMATLFTTMAVTDHDINRKYLVGATGNMDQGRALFMDGSEATRVNTEIWTVTKEAIMVGEIPADFPNPPGTVEA